MANKKKKMKPAKGKRRNDPARDLHDLMANTIRFLAADAVQQANSGHPGMPMGMADVATVLFTRYLKYDPTRPEWPDRDRFVLSAGHGSMLLYALLHLTGYPEMTIGELRNFRQLGSKTAGHPEYGHAPGIETTTGPLGQGLATAVGMALAERMLATRFGRHAVDHYTYAVAGDGCLMEGISHEAISFAGHFGLGKLIVFWDDNRISIDGKTDLAVSDNQLARFRASGWDAVAIDGHEPAAIAGAIERARASTQPSLIACRTVIGFGAPKLAGSHKTHGSPLGADEIKAMREKLDWGYAPFEIPPASLAAWRKAGARGAKTHAAWEKRLRAMAAADRAEFARRAFGRLPDGWGAQLAAHKRKMAEEKPKVATRQASGAALEVLTAAIPEMIGGSADLTGSVNTQTKCTLPVTPEDFSGRYIHYGVREHAMAAIMNGMALHRGFIPYSGTFLIFTDYMKAAMRLSALMGQRAIYVLTHDSIGLGEDGPTHQPVETLASLRAMPNFTVFRPCDAIETAECWELALERESGPSGMVLTRQGLPTLRTTHQDANLSARGAYVLAEAAGGSAARWATLLATGSEVAIAVEAKKLLEADGVPTAVVSMPCWELFEEQDAAYRNQVLGSAPRVAVEAAVRFGWDRYLGPRGAFVGMSTFGASAPAPKLYDHFGITPAAVAAAAKALL
ncbi:MAG: transketolase [Rhodospirillales bacterium]|nr:transketolase [Rhodospirillales bacterium]MSP80502.1 transketolase [Rhodospirillales bacterium]